MLRIMRISRGVLVANGNLAAQKLPDYPMTSSQRPSGRALDQLRAVRIERQFTKQRVQERRPRPMI